MKRREFVKSVGTLSIAISSLPSLGFAFSSVNSRNPILKRSYVLKGFDDEQEESPSIVSDDAGNLWMFSLRRLSYPNDSELISAFKYDGKNWQEVDSVTKVAGQFETPIVACAFNGKPVVAWTNINNGDWNIQVAVSSKNGFKNPFTLKTEKGKSINPVVIAPDKNRNWIAWENLHNGKFTILISKYSNREWSKPLVVDKGDNSCFDPAIAEHKNGDLYLAYGLTDGFHQNIEMSIIDGSSMEVKKTIPIAIGGGLKYRVNQNTKPAIAFDINENLWISYESNRNASRLEDGDNYTGDKCCTILSYQDGKIKEVASTGKWLFEGKNDHKPTFTKDNLGNLYLTTHCGGDFNGNPYWKYRLSWLEPKTGWQKPTTIYQTKQKSVLILPAIAFDSENNLWLSTCVEKFFENYEPVKSLDINRSRLSQLTVMQFSKPSLNKEFCNINFVETKVEEFRPDENKISTYSGHPKVERVKTIINGEEYSLVYGNLHEHSESSNCWPAGTDGTLHEDYRFGMFAENYDFVGITDHGTTINEVYWRKNIRLANFYNQSDKFVAIPAMEWALQTDGKIDKIQHAVGHYNVIFATSEDAQKFIRNKHEIFSILAPEAYDAIALWNLLHEKNINCITIPHHPADETHPVDWDVYDEKFVTVVEMFQCRGNHEYPGCPREINLSRHRPTKHKKAYVDYALKEKGYKLGFVASGDHNSMGIGLAAVWVKEFSRKGILEGLKNRRCFATTGDKFLIDFRINGIFNGQTIKLNSKPVLSIKTKGQKPLYKVEIIRNSKLIKEFYISNNSHEFKKEYTDDHIPTSEILYYYIRVRQKNNEIAWSSPIWVEPI